MSKSTCSRRLAIAFLARASPLSATVGLTCVTLVPTRKTVSVGVLPDLEVAAPYPAQFVHVCDAAKRVSSVLSSRRTRAWYHVPHWALFRKFSAQEVGIGLCFQAAPRRIRSYGVELHANRLATPDHRAALPYSSATAGRRSETTQR